MSRDLTGLDGLDFIEAFLAGTTPLFDEVLDEIGYPADVDTEYQVLMAQAVMDLFAGRAP